MTFVWGTARSTKPRLYRFDLLAAGERLVIEYRDAKHLASIRASCWQHARWEGKKFKSKADGKEITIKRLT